MRLVSLRSAGLASALLMTLSVAAMAQRPSGAGAPPSHPQPAPQAGKGVENRPATSPKGEPKNFTGVAKQLGTTPQALDAAYKTALQANPKLTRGQFIAANIVAKNLSGKNPAVTTQAILDGFASGKSIGQTLEGLGVSADQAKSAEAEANNEAQGKGQDKKPQQ